MSTLAANKKYIDSLMKKAVMATEVYTQAVVLETFKWLTVMTVQDSGNAAYNWQLSVSGGSVSTGDFKGVGEVGFRGELRRPATEVSGSDTLEGLTAAASLTPYGALEGAQNNVLKISMDQKSFSLPNVALINSIDTLGKGYEYYAANALGLITQAEAIKFGSERGNESAKRKQVVRNVT